MQIAVFTACSDHATCLFVRSWSGRGPSRTYVSPNLWTYVLGIYIASGAQAYALALAPKRKPLRIIVGQESNLGQSWILSLLPILD